MISFIICSVDPARAAKVTANIRATVGVQHEILLHDNREAYWGLGRVYNHYAAQAQGDILCFMHEDVAFLTAGWGAIVERFYAGHPEAGVVGFFGSPIKTRTPSGIGWCRHLDMSSYVQLYNDGREKTIIRGIGDYSPVVTIDGMCLIVPRRVWDGHRFDEATFDGFHLYDLDFTVNVALDRVNYICHKILIRHDSEGCNDGQWLHYTRLFHDKWRDRLPITAIPLSRRAIRTIEAYISYKFYRNILRSRQTGWVDYAREHFDRAGSIYFRIRLSRYVRSYRRWLKKS